jgi:Flp pilus assembly protein TadD
MHIVLRHILLMKWYVMLILLSSMLLIVCKKEEAKVQVIGESQKSATYVGRDSCAACHQRENQLWRNSHHDHAMEVANENTVLGNFDNAVFTHFGITSKFYRRDDKYLVFTEGPQGEFEEFEIAYTFGYNPLQQYLIAFPNGRFQVLGICWDTRPKEVGGQRWFHIHPDERIDPDDVLYWTHVSQNWNYMCAECHSTNFQKNYYPGEDLYESSWSEIDVSCESCHGPGSEHLEWARIQAYDESVRKSKNMGLQVVLKDPLRGSWIFKENDSTAEKTTSRGSDVLIETCGRCHARRSMVTEKYFHGKFLLETHRPQLLTEGYYFADGQIRDEVYVYSSFLQTKMYQKGVICIDCHEPHGLTTYARGNALCYRCHLHAKYGSREHHFHDPDSAGADCADCHMHERIYMVIDPRRDHSIRIPRPDLSSTINSPNACNQCHQDKSIGWAVANVKKWYGESFVERSHYGRAFAAGRLGKPGADTALIQLIVDRDTPNIVRATALDLLRRYPSKAALQIIESSLTFKDPLVRLAAVDVTEALNHENQVRLLKPMLSDPLKVIRAEAARILSALPDYMFSYNERRQLNAVIEEYAEIQMVIADNPAAHLNLGVLYTHRGTFDKAELAYQQAIRLEIDYFHAYINLADLYRLRQQENIAEEILLKAVDKFPDTPEVYYALGLSLVRQKRPREALKFLEKAVSLRPADAELNYTYGVALNSQGKSDMAIKILAEAFEANPYHPNLLYALVTIHRDRGEIEKSLRYALKLAELTPNDRDLQRLIKQLQKD